MTMLRFLLIAGVLATGAGGLSSVATATTVLPINPSLYHDFKARGVGDVVTILIVESTSASKSASTETASRVNSNGVGTGHFDFIDFWNLGVDNSSEGGGTTRRQGNLTAQITANVIEIDPSGLLIIEGVRSVRVNGEEERILLHGKVRPQDVRRDNTVYSTYLTDAAIEFTGHGSLDNASEPGIITRIMNWLF